jgi:hypothetical protein
MGLVTPPKISCVVIPFQSSDKGIKLIELDLIRKQDLTGSLNVLEFWAKGSNLGIISKLIHADNAERVKTVMDKKWKL